MNGPRTLAALMLMSVLAPEAWAQAAEPGNPLWAVPLDRLDALNERPLFSPSRRPPPTRDVEASAPPPPPPPPSAPARPSLELTGILANGGDGFGLFVDTGTQADVTLRVGQIHAGWRLDSISDRAAVLRQDDLESRLELPRPDTSAMPVDAGETGPKPGDEPIFYPEH
ncbi:hypothetical protein [Terrihabitans sp. B22-R8]|uniref:hypothetical protein n=1 Tax=Terrihabitans sp. B22-R8 TaxID=3425128 RepID=UPI00403D0864